MGLAGIIDTITVWAQSVISTLGYPGLVLVMFLENVFPPIPSEAVLPLAGWLVLEGRFTILGVILMGAVGSFAGAMLFYGLGYWFGEQRVRVLVRRYGRWLALSEEDLDRSLTWFGRYGEGVIFFGRMVPLIRSLVSIPAGIAAMRLPRFSLYTLVGSSLWNLILVYAGYLLGQNWHLVTEWIERYEKIVLVLVVVGLLVFILFRLWRRRMRRAAAIEINVADSVEEDSSGL